VRLSDEVDEFRCDNPKKSNFLVSSRVSKHGFEAFLRVLAKQVQTQNFIVV